MLPLLQISTTDSALNQLPEGATSPDLVESITLFELLSKGGWVMVVLGLLLLIAIYLFIERLIAIQKARKNPKQLLQQVKEAVRRGDIESAKVACARQTTPMSNLLQSGLNHIGSTLKNIEASIENTGKLEVYRLEKNVGVLGTISGVAPMIGFLGTVIGMINAFMSMSQAEGAISAKELSTGIYEAMVTTAGGLCVGIIAYIAYNYLVRLVGDVVHHMEVVSIEFIDLLQQPS